MVERALQHVVAAEPEQPVTVGQGGEAVVAVRAYDGAQERGGREGPVGWLYGHVEALPYSHLDYKRYQPILHSQDAPDA